MLHLPIALALRFLLAITSLIIGRNYKMGYSIGRTKIFEDFIRVFQAPYHDAKGVKTHVMKNGFRDSILFTKF